MVHNGQNIVNNVYESPLVNVWFAKKDTKHSSKCITTMIGTVKLGNKERFNKEQIGIKELFMDYQPFYTINLLLDKELLPV